MAKSVYLKTSSLMFFFLIFLFTLISTREQAKAKKCVKKLMTPNCTFPALLQEMIDLSLSDYNPYCENNRDPGATGNDQCYGVKDLTATSVAARPKSTVLQALFISLLISMVFFVKGSNNDIFPL